MTRAPGGAGARSLYVNRRMLAIALMGFSSGLPLLLTTGTLGYWLARVGVDRTAIGLFALVGLPYTLKFAWAPALDRVTLPWLGPALGRRRSWALASQLCLAAAILGLGATDPAHAPLATAAWAVAVAFLSATQDVAVDAYRIEVLDDDEQGAGAAVTQAGYRLGMLCAGAGAIAVSDFVGWPWVFGALAALVGVGTAGVLLGPEPRRPAALGAPGHGDDPPRAASADGSPRAETPRAARAVPLRAEPPAAAAGVSLRAGSFLGALQRAVVEPLREFAARPGWVALLLFALLYKFGDAVAGVMANPFYVSLGFTGVEIASASNVLGLVANLAGVFAGGLLVARTGIVRALLWGGVLQAVTNLLFAALALVGREFELLVVAVGADAFTGGLASAAFVAFLSELARGGSTATQYALLTSLMAGGRTVLSSGGGWLAERLAWPLFFASTTLLAVPGLLLLLWLVRRHGSMMRAGLARGALSPRPAPVEPAAQDSPPHPP